MTSDSTPVALPEVLTEVRRHALGQLARAQRFWLLMKTRTWSPMRGLTLW